MPNASPSHSRLCSPRRKRRAAGSSVRWRREVPEAIRFLDTLTDVNYADIVTAAVSETSSRTPEQWVRAMFEGVPHGLLFFVPFVQRAALGLRLEPRASPDHILGWKIADRGDNWVRLEAASWFLTGHVLVHVDRGQLSFATFVRYDRPLAALVWPPVSLIHRQVALSLMHSAARAR
jgi:hypothetical protein